MQNNFESTSYKKPVKTGKYTEINKQSQVKFWLNGIKYGAVSYSLSCTTNKINLTELEVAAVVVVFLALCVIEPFSVEFGVVWLVGPGLADLHLGLDGHPLLNCTFLGTFVADVAVP